MVSVSERSIEPISHEDLVAVLDGSWKRVRKHFVDGPGKKWANLYDIDKPLAVALCQGAAMHYHDHVNGVKDFDVWFLYPFNGRHLPYRTIWTWDYDVPKFGRHPDFHGYKGRKVDVLVRSVRNFDASDPRHSFYRFLQTEGTETARLLSQKAVVLLEPPHRLGELIWYKGPVGAA
jgi:hypothetical protein